MSASRQLQAPDLAAVTAACSGDPAAIVAFVQRLVEDHGHSSESVVNLVASHNRLSPAALAMLSSSVAEHIMSGQLGKREHAGGAFIDAIDTVVVQLSRTLFGAGAVEYRAMSGALANGLALFALAKPGDTILAQPARFGGHYSYREAGYGGARGLRIVDIPCREDGAFDLEALAATAKRERPRAIVVGTAWMLEPLPVAALRTIADGCDAKLFYDGAHILGLVAGGQFQDPLREGAHVLAGSTQKTLGGPIGGLVLASDAALGEAISSATSGVISNYHNNRVAALAVTLAETARFGREFAAQIVQNARTLAQALVERGVPVVGRAPLYTASHVVLIDPRKLPDAEQAFRRLEAARILTTRVPLAETYPDRRGLRLGTPAVTRAGMGAEEMRTIAALIKRVLVDREEPSRVAGEASALAKAFPGVRYC
jgi:glycine hydroxymethyltransferase